MPHPSWNDSYASGVLPWARDSRSPCSLSLSLLEESRRGERSKSDRVLGQTQFGWPSVASMCSESMFRRCGRKSPRQNRGLPATLRLRDIGLSRRAPTRRPVPFHLRPRLLSCLPPPRGALALCRLRGCRIGTRRLVAEPDRQHGRSAA